MSPRTTDKRAPIALLQSSAAKNSDEFSPLCLEEKKKGKIDDVTEQARLHKKQEIVRWHKKSGLHKNVRSVHVPANKAGGLVVGALRIVCNGVRTVARFHSAEDNPRCRYSNFSGLGTAIFND